MNKPIVLLVHGMGTHAPGEFTAEFKSGLQESAELLGLSELNLDDILDIQEYNYSEYFDAERKKQGDFFTELKAVASFAPSVLEKLINFQSKLGEDNFLYTHWLDVVTYGLLDTIRIQASLKMKLQVLTLLKQASLEDRPLYIMAHSLGTAMTHDVLTDIYAQSDQLDLLNNEKLRYVNHPITSLWMVANVSRLTQLLTKLIDPKHSIVRDDTYDHPGVAKTFYSVFNEFDPFTALKRYELRPKYGSLIRTNGVRLLTEEDGSKSVNPHSFAEYLADPKVGGKFLKQLRKYTKVRISDAMIVHASTKYKASTVQESVLEQINNNVDYIKGLSERLQSGDTATIIEALMELFELADKIQRRDRGDN